MQRQCSGGCGTHTIAGGQCSDCKKKLDIQRQLRVGEANDVYEREADHVADRVMSAPVGGQVRNAPLRIQRYSSTAAADPVSAPASVDRTLASSGEPLPQTLRHDMEQRFGHDFSQVRVHSGSYASQSAADINANAYTVGHDIVFGAGRFRPGTHEGRHLLAHELTHVVQQRGGESSASVLHKQSSDVIQRDVDEDEIDMGENLPSTSTPGSPTEFGPTNTDPTCPPVPTGLQNVRPDPPCPSGPMPNAGSHFQFCTDSDVLRAQSLGFLRNFARGQRSGSIFNVHGFASKDGPTQGNLNLSCHRAKRTARELENAGVPSQDIRIFAHGETDLWGPTPPDNQVAIVEADAPEGQTTPTARAATSLRDAVDQAVARIMARDYRLAADAYLSRWTCGRIPNLAEMIRRTTILVEGESAPRTRINRPADPADQSARLGHPNLEGLREIVIANEVFTQASDPVLCAAARIVDMAFHHFLAPQLGVGPNDPPVHSAALFLVGLAGFPPCTTTVGTLPGSDVPVTGGDAWWTTPAADPLRRRQTGCANDQPLPGATDTTQLPARPERIPTFAVTDRRLEATEANINATLNRPENRLTVTPPARTVVMDATVSATGDPSTIGRYQIGWMHTLVSDEQEVNYVGGQRVRREVPVPMRARSSPSEADVPPWSNPPGIVTASRTAPVTTSFNIAPSATMEFLFEEPTLRRPTDLGIHPRQAENPINTAQINRTYNAWVVARRDDAPLDRFNTHFLQGHEARVTLNVDVVGDQTTANVRSTVDDTNLGDPAPMQLRGSTEDQVSSDDRIVEVAPPTPRGQVQNAMTIAEVRARVREVADELEPLREALHLDGRITVRVNFDRATGRMVIHTERRPATSVEENGTDEEREGVGEAGRRQLAREFMVRLRKDLVLAPNQHEMVPTSFTSLPSFNDRRRRRGSPDPYAAEHGIGLLAQIREQQELDRSQEQLRNQPNVYDPTFSPDVQVELERERYCFNFTVSGVDIDSVCVDPTMRTEGCVRAFPAQTFTLRSDPRFVTQQLNGETFESPVALRVTTFPMRFIMFTPRESPGGDTFNHEMHHMIDSFNQVQMVKERMARRIRARLIQIRRMAAENPRLKGSLLSRQTILEIVAQENRPFQEFFGGAFERRGGEMHTREARQGGLPPYRTALPREWNTFREPPLRGGTAGSFDHRPCP